MAPAGCFNVRVSPLVLLSACDSCVRRGEGQARVIGTLLGSGAAGVVDVKDCFTVPHSDAMDQASGFGDGRGVGAEPRCFHSQPAVCARAGGRRPPPVRARPLAPALAATGGAPTWRPAPRPAHRPRSLGPAGGCVAGRPPPIAAALLP